MSNHVEDFTLRGERGTSRTRVGYTRFKVQDGIYLTVSDDGRVRLRVDPGHKVNVRHDNTEYPGTITYDVTPDQ